MELIGQGLQDTFDFFEIDGVCTYEGEDFCIYELSEKEYDKLQNIADADFDDVTPKAWYRYVEEEIHPHAISTTPFIINGEIMYGIPDRKDRKEFECLTDYMINALGVGLSVNNVAVMSMRLAVINDISQAALWSIFEG